LKRISKYDGLNKNKWIISIIEFIEDIKGGIKWRGKKEEGLIEEEVLSIVKWLLKSIKNEIKNMKEIRNGGIEIE
jgi:hypothetical protein